MLKHFCSLDIELITNGQFGAQIFNQFLFSGVLLAMSGSTASTWTLAARATSSARTVAPAPLSSLPARPPASSAHARSDSRTLCARHRCRTCATARPANTEAPATCPPWAATHALVRGAGRGDTAPSRTTVPPTRAETEPTAPLYRTDPMPIVALAEKDTLALTVISMWMSATSWTESPILANMESVWTHTEATSKSMLIWVRAHEEHCCEAGAR